MTSADQPGGQSDEDADLAAGVGESQESAGPAPTGAAARDVANSRDVSGDTAGDTLGDMSGDSPMDLLVDLAGAQQAVADLTTDLQRLQAEYVNYKRRVDRDRVLVQQNATFTVLSSLLPVLDDLDRARDHGELEGGFKAVADSLERIVAGQGLVKFGKPGDEFDPNFHEALIHAHSADVTKTTCQSIISSGYQIGARVVRPARVTVVDPVPEPEPGTEPETGTETETGPGTETGAARENDPANDTQH